MNYDWLANLALFGTTIALTLIGRFIAFKIPAIQRMRELNNEVERERMSVSRFRDAVNASNRSALATNAFFFLAILPFAVNLEPRPIWRHLVDIAIVLMVFDFFYYMTHRFIFHGNLLRKVHSLHHQARQPTYIDALYVHPLETSIGLILFLGSIPVVAALVGGPLSAYSMAIAMLLFTQLNTINHTFVNLPYFPFKILDNITSIHAAHHVDMNKGNFATLTMIYDRIFATFEEPVHRETP